MTNSNSRTPKAEDIAYARYQVPDLSLMRPFLEDFGFEITEGQSETGAPAIYSRGLDQSPYLHVCEEGEKKFLGMGFHMQSEADFEALSAMEGASPRHDVPGVPGAKRIRFTDPNGFEVDGLIGFAVGDEHALPENRPYNSISTRERVGEAIELNPGRVRIHRFGHLVANVVDFRVSEAWYKERFGFITGHDIYVKDEENILGAFLRCDLGAKPSDHHTFFLVGMGEARHGHAAFEVENWDAVMLGHDHMTAKGYNPHWGIGKHKLGSQVFDYWLDPFDNVLEHFTDGDVFDSSTPPTVEPIEKLLGVQWGPPKPTSNVPM